MRVSSILMALAISVCAQQVESAPTPVHLTPQPIGSGKLTISSAVATGKVRYLHPLRTVGSMDDFYWDSPHRAAIGTPTGWKLVDPSTDRVIANIPKPNYFGRLSPNELVVERGRIESVIALDTGAELAPVPKLPITAPLESLSVLHAREGGGDVFLMATAGGRTFVGLWNDRSPAPALNHEIDTPPGWEVHRRADGIELQMPVAKTCKGLRLFRAKPPQCVPMFDHHHAAITGSWELELADRADGHTDLIAHDQQSGREEVIDMICPDAMLHANETTPRALVTCSPTAKTPFAYTWTPGTARTLDTATGERFNGRNFVGSVFTIKGYNSVDRFWLALDQGTLLEGPPMKDLFPTEDSTRSIGVTGQGAATRLSIIDGAARTARSFAAPCAGEILVDKVHAQFIAVSCGLRSRPGYFDFAHVWSKVIDVEHAKVWDVPGYPTAVFADGTAIVSNRTRLTAETRGPNARMSVVVLE